MNFLFKNFLLSQICGFCESCGGSTGFLSYIIMLLHFTKSEKTSTVVHCDALLRQHFSRLSSAGQPFILPIECSKVFDHFLMRARSEMDRVFADKRAAASPPPKAGQGKGNRFSNKPFYQYDQGNRNVYQSQGFVGSYGPPQYGQQHNQLSYGPMVYNNNQATSSAYPYSTPQQKGGKRQRS